MTLNGRQDDNIDKQTASNPSSQTGLENAARRRFGKSGLAASGILATLASRPALGAVCKSPSGFLSGNLSHHGPAPVCAGRSPGYWKTHSWPAGVNKNAVTFGSVFTCPKFSPYFSVKMVTLLNPDECAFDKHNLGMHLVAAYLNSLAGWSPFLTVSTLRSMWTELQTVGYFTPTAGVKWTAEQVVSYIQQTYAY